MTWKSSRASAWSPSLLPVPEPTKLLAVVSPRPELGAGNALNKVRPCGVTSIFEMRPPPYWVRLEVVLAAFRQVLRTRLVGTFSSRLAPTFWRAP
ncbi:hypothetical protein [Tunturiibacter gelidoferens]|uniref:Uncharacterized protein n=1 Tax=Tunturiibacter gelidiferens TaxID=3069689 RepID=A0A9X0QKD3_9BACT|nr:hypothetical protein [Edaphobacter lichenicola]MBB5331754.1 hypothetical protein [Edaphobacter lichenicola]